MPAQKFEAFLIQEDGTTQVIHPSGDKFTLEELQGHVGGYIQMLPVPKKPGKERLIALVDEEGLLRNKSFNPVASKAVGFDLVGPAIVMPKRMMR